MKTQEIEKIKTLITNYEASKKTIPFLADLEQHSLFWPIFQGLSAQEKQEVTLIIDEFIQEKIQIIKKTKWGQLFARFFEAQEELFWTFRKMNEPGTLAKDFQVVGKRVETEMFKLEGILTEKMVKQEKGLDAVIGAFYNLVYLFFPRWNEIE